MSTSLAVGGTGPARRRRDNLLVSLLLIVVMLLGGYFRFVGQNWDDYTHFHPDERFLAQVASGIGGSLSSALLTAPSPEIRQQQYERCLARYPESGGAGGYFDAECSTLNPHNAGFGLFVYGSLPLFITYWTADLADQVAGSPLGQTLLGGDSGTALPSTWSSYDGIHLVWRFLSALADMGVIVMVFVIGLRLHGKWTGLVAAALYAAAVFPIQQAHFGTADSITNFFSVMAILFAIRVQLRGRWYDYVFFGVAFGAALASRINVAPLVGLIILAAGLRALPAFDRRIAWGERERVLIGALSGLVLAGFFTVVCFRIFNPYAFIGPGFFGLGINPRWTADLGQAQYLVSGSAEIPPNWQWVGRASYLYPFANMVLWGMGAALGLAGWLSWVWAGYRLLRGRPGATLNLLLFAFVLVYFGWLGRQWVTTMRYFLPLYPVLAVLAGWGLVAFWRYARSARRFAASRRLVAASSLVLVVALTGLWAAMFTNIYRNQSTIVQSGIWVWENIPGDFSMQIEGADPSTPLINIAVYNNPLGRENDILSQATTYEDGQIVGYEFVAPASGMITHVHAPHLADPVGENGDPEPESIRVTISGSNSFEPLATGTLVANLTRDEHVVGSAYDIPLDEPLVVTAGELYTFRVEIVSGGPVASAGAIFAYEGDWDEPVPAKTCTLPFGVTLADNPPPGLLSAAECNGRDPWTSLINGYKLQIIYDDITDKRDLMQRALDNSDYLIIGTNRRYDSQSRIPGRWPMTMAYYDALFSGELGFEIEAMFEETFELGPLHISDQYLPTYDAPAWLNEFEAEEAFHVYDHPVVYIFRKTDAYSSANTQRVLNSVPLNSQGVVSFNCPEAEGNPLVNFYCDPTLIGITPLRVEGLDFSLSADEAPTGLEFPDEMRQTQYESGTWADRFDTASIVNTQPVVTVILWWLAMLLFGWAVWPLLFTLLPGLADRGYGFAKMIGIFLVGWLAWVLASARLPVWSQPGVFFCLLLVAVASALVAWRSRARIGAYIQDRWRRLLWIEVITLVAFIAFLIVRLMNPDLWHPQFGGEKPMDFAYFNGVLRSTVFPPVDPWFVDGYINYYYFGFVIVGTPVLLLGIVPSVAYNLILPTLFALTGIAAFSVAFNIVSAWQERRAAPADENDVTPPVARFRLGNPWVAGVAALLLCVVLGNLDTPRVLLSELARIGGYQMPASFEDYLTSQYVAENGVQPSGEAQMDILNRVATNASGDRLRYELDTITGSVSGVFAGLGRVLQGEPIAVSPERWFWAPTRVLTEPPVNSGGAITEMPYFTFLYGDLHAHMIAMPLQLFVLAFLFNELILAGEDRRRVVNRWLALALGALVIGMLRATNTWDWLTYMILGVLGLAYAWYLRWRTITRWSLLHLVAYVGGFVGLTALLALPYTTWYASAYTQALPWQGNRTPLWAYFDIHGLFLFLLFCLLLWDTARWLRSVYVRSLTGMWWLLLAGLIVVLALVAGSIILAVASYQVSLVAIPLITWIAILFFRAGQSRPMQFILVLAGLALSLTLGVEFVVLGGDIGRQNTVFKFYIQAWLLFAVMGGVAFAWLWHSAVRWSGPLRGVWTVVLALLVFAAALFPLMATPAKAVYRMAPSMPLTLDGMDFMQYAAQFEGSPAVLAENPEASPFRLADDYQMIRWLQENAQGTPVIAEGRSEREYLWGGRISIYTGLPSIVGWNWHQRQQRTFNPLPRLVEQRVANVNALYVTADIGTVWDIIQHYDVEYIVVGGLERAYYTQDNLAKFEEMVELGLLEVVLETEGGSQLYHVIPDAQYEQVNELAGLVGS